MTENKMVIKEITYIEFSIRLSRTKYLLKKPANGGIPAIDNKLNANVAANTGSFLDNPLNSLI
jgi:hypothetical protein